MNERTTNDTDWRAHLMSTAVARRASEPKGIGRTLKTLIPLIQEDLENGDRAGMEYYADAGDKLIEAKSQVAHGYWGTWLSKNLHVGAAQARRYMRLAEIRVNQQNDRSPIVLPSFNELTGKKEQTRKRRASERPFRAVLEDLDTDFYTQEKQTREDEVRLHREMALELVDIGYKALATRLHPDRGGSKDAMVRLNRVREELKGVAERKRFV